MPQKKLSPNDIEWFTTEDGSITGRRRDLGIHYKSVYGAQTESQHIFIHASGLKKIETDWHVGELGFGMGSNFSQAAVAAKTLKKRLFYESVDHQPPPPESIPPHQPYAALIQQALSTARDQDGPVEVSEAHIVLRLYPSDWTKTTFKNSRLDIAFHDPFAPADNPESWTADCFQWWRQSLSPSGRLATYSAAGHVRRALAAAGFWVARTAGPGKKREITIASPSSVTLSDCDIIPKYKPSCAL